MDDLIERRRLWGLFGAAPSPLGFDPAPVYGFSHDPTFGPLKLNAWHMLLAGTTAPDHYRAGWTRGRGWVGHIASSD
ncbi:MAG: hypothetical protein M3Q03_15240 [Chloroflexota bacterium]|nr:hypothetical protein [Chloroflexota bacterium]